MLIITNKFLCHKRGTVSGERVRDFVFRFPFSPFIPPPLRDKVRYIFVVTDSTPKVGVVPRRGEGVCPKPLSVFRFPL